MVQYQSAAGATSEPLLDLICAHTDPPVGLLRSDVLYETDEDDDDHRRHVGLDGTNVALSTWQPVLSRSSVHLCAIHPAGSAISITPGQTIHEFVKI